MSKHRDSNQNKFKTVFQTHVDEKTDTKRKSESKRNTTGRNSEKDTRIAEKK